MVFLKNKVIFLKNYISMTLLTGVDRIDKGGNDFFCRHPEQGQTGCNA